MARIRSIKPEFCVSEQLGECSTNARLVFALMWMFCDDNGVHPAKPRTLKAEVFPMDDFTAEEVSGWVSELLRAGLLREYTVNSETYWIVTGWAKHQKIDRPSSKYPLPFDDDSTSIRRGLDEPHPPESSRVEGKGEEEKLSSSSADADDQQAGKATKLESRLAQITADAIETFNASSLTKPEGLLSRVTLDSSVRRKQVKRCLDVARAICRRMYGSERITAQFWTDYWLAALADDFAAGRTQPGRGHESWRPDFEYLTRPDVMTKLFDRAVEDAA